MNAKINILEFRSARRVFLPGLVVAGSLGLWAGGPAAQAQEASQAASQTANGVRTDGQIEMDVVHALDAAPELKQDWITAGTVQGQVTLSGTSATAANRQLAESLAGKIAGVTKVVNNLKVGDTQAAADGAQPQDQVDYANQEQPAQGQSAQADQNADNAGPLPMPSPSPDQQQQPVQQAQRPQYQPYPGQPGPQNYPQQPYSQSQPSRGPEPPRAPVTLEAGTLLRVRSSQPLDSKHAQIGTPVDFTVVRDVYANGILAIPRGANIRGQVTDVRGPGAISGSPELALRLDALELDGRSYPLDSTPFQVRGPSKTGHTVGNAIGGALFGALIGGAVGGGGGAAIGAAAGGVGGTAASAATPGPRVWIPAEALMDFHLNTPVTVTPVSAWEAQRLSANAPPPSQRPTLYRRAYAPYGYPPPPPPPGYYRPY